MKILVVDDEPIVLTCCGRILEEQGHAVLLVGSAEAAMAAMAAEPCGVLLVDIKMPGRDGLDLVREIKQKWPETSVLVMTGYSTPATIQETRTARADAFIAKPFTPDELLEILNPILSKGGRR
jgi:DNA-binding NtrC family response regulator